MGKKNESNGLGEKERTTRSRSDRSSKKKSKIEVQRTHVGVLEFNQTFVTPFRDGDSQDLGDLLESLLEKSLLSSLW